mmetsp:Transcript_9043/g.28211  ORF Transcript_9043/g.28211 Transcript_9043/m.28211 type:complete len:455 (-) Transcript_9043:351-1715(-)
MLLRGDLVRPLLVHPHLDLYPEGQEEADVGLADELQLRPPLLDQDHAGAEAVERTAQSWRLTVEGVHIQEAADHRLRGGHDGRPDHPGVGDQRHPQLDHIPVQFTAPLSTEAADEVLVDDPCRTDLLLDELVRIPKLRERPRRLLGKGQHRHLREPLALQVLLPLLHLLPLELLCPQDPPLLGLVQPADLAVLFLLLNLLASMVDCVVPREAPQGLLLELQQPPPRRGLRDLPSVPVQEVHAPVVVPLPGAPLFQHRPHMLLELLPLRGLALEHGHARLPAAPDLLHLGSDLGPREHDLDDTKRHQEPVGALARLCLRCHEELSAGWHRAAAVEATDILRVIRCGHQSVLVDKLVFLALEVVAPGRRPLAGRGAPQRGRHAGCPREGDRHGSGPARQADPVVPGAAGRDGLRDGLVPADRADRRDRVPAGEGHVDALHEVVVGLLHPSDVPGSM